MKKSKSMPIIKKMRKQLKLKIKYYKAQFHSLKLLR